MTHANLPPELHNKNVDLGIILGSGLSHVVDAFNIDATISYHDIPGFLPCSVSGHRGQLALATHQNLHIACFQGRFHWYEGISGETYMAMMSLLQTLGCPNLLLLNAAGSLREDRPVGTISLIRDHINLQGKSPLVGIKPTPFIGMTQAYDPDWIQTIQETALQHDISIPTGVYAGVLGPQFETPAEIHMLRTLGADLVGMSTVPEVIAARAHGIKVAALSLVTNMAAGMHEETLSHDITLAGAKASEKTVQKLVHLICQQKSEHLNDPT